jgi:hypothetical protein
MKEHYTANQLVQKMHMLKVHHPKTKPTSRKERLFVWAFSSCRIGLTTHQVVRLVPLCFRQYIPALIYYTRKESLNMQMQRLREWLLLWVLYALSIPACQEYHLPFFLGVECEVTFRKVGLSFLGRSLERR